LITDTFAAQIVGTGSPKALRVPKSGSTNTGVQLTTGDPCHHQLALLSSAIIMPRQCGIATFTTRHLRGGRMRSIPQCDCLVGAVNDRPEGYEYPARVRFEIDEKELDSYRRAADFLNINNVEIVSVQHEFGIYGGPAGGHLLAFLRDVHMPVVTTLHTVLSGIRRSDQRAVMKQIG
jgi:hypothetical protein